MSSKMAQNDFVEVLQDVDRWGDIHELVALCDERGYWNDEFFQNALYLAKAAHIRRQIRQVKDEDGQPRWHSVETLSDEGKPVRVYKQETFFDVEDYKQVVKYHMERSSYHSAYARRLVKNCTERFGVQLQLSFEE